jgi:hypothetical protein
MQILEENCNCDNSTSKHLITLILGPINLKGILPIFILEHIFTCTVGFNHCSNIVELDCYQLSAKLRVGRPAMFLH